MIDIQECPCCGGNSFIKMLTAKDQTVSHETFSIKQCTDCHFLLTSPRPETDNLHKYYEAADYISHNTRSRSFFDIVYRTARQFTLQWKLSLINKYNIGPQKSLLDYGCGTGNFLDHITRNAWTSTGVEPSETARTQLPPKVKDHVFSNLNEVPNKSFSTITLWHVLEHIPNLHQTLELLADRLTQNSTLFLAVPNPQSQNARYYKEHWAAYDVPRHLWHFTPETMAQILAQHNLNILETIPMKLDAYYISLLSEKYRGKTPASAAINGLIQGFKSNQRAKGTNQYASLIYIVRQ